jgi:hypothetical protein
LRPFQKLLICKVFLLGGSRDLRAVDADIAEGASL